MSRRAFRLVRRKLLRMLKNPILPTQDLLVSEVMRATADINIITIVSSHTLALQIRNQGLRPRTRTVISFSDGCFIATERPF